MNLNNCQILVVGFGITGVPLVDFLHKKGASVTLNDAKKRNELQEALKHIENYNVRTVLGGHPLDLSLYGNPEMIIVSPGVPVDLPFLQAFRKKGIPVIGEIELAFRFMKAPVVAITGTNGKTTTTALTGEIFRLGGKSPEVVGNIGIPAISKAEALGSDQFYVMEVSSFQLETIELFRPKAAALLNITPDHLNRHGSMEAYASLKYRIFENQQEDDVSVINADDAACMTYREQLKSRKCFFSRFNKLPEGVFIEHEEMIARWNDAEKHLIHIGKIGIPGSHNLENAMAAAALAITSGVSEEAVREGLETFKGVAHRIEHVATIDGVDYVNDSKATNPDAAIKAVEAVEAPIILLAGGMDKKNDFTALIKTFEDKVKWLYVYGETAAQLIETAHSVGFQKISNVSDLEEAVMSAASISRSGDTVLLSPACASWDMYTSFEERGNHFKSLVSKIQKDRLMYQ